MKLTNDYGLPSGLFNAIKNDTYNRGDSDYTATQLIQPARITVLKDRYKDELTEDASDVLYRLYGKLAHAICEQENENDLIETRYYADFMGYKVSAQLDTLCLYSGVLSDYKFTSWYGFKFGAEPKFEWVAQLNIQLELLRKNEMDAEKIQIIGLLRDWKQSDTKRINGYPQLPVAILDIPIWARKKTQDFIRKQIKAIELAKENLSPCNNEDTWQGRRCENFCIVNKFCDQYQQTKENQ